MHTKMSLNVRHRVVSPAGIAERTCIYPNQAQTLARERVTRQPPTLDCGSTSRGVQFAFEGCQPVGHFVGAGKRRHSSTRILSVSNAFEPIRPDPHPLNYLNLHTKGVFLKQVAETIPVDQVDRNGAVTDSLFRRLARESALATMTPT